MLSNCYRAGAVPNLKKPEPKTLASAKSKPLHSENPKTLNP